jgi:hypothetical protein
MNAPVSSETTIMSDLEKAEMLKQLRAELAAAGTRAAVLIDDESYDAWARAIELQREIEALESPQIQTIDNVASPAPPTELDIRDDGDCCNDTPF